MRYRSLPILAFLLMLPVLASAQSLGTSIGGVDPFTVSINPQYPAPGSQTTLSFVSSMIDLANAVLTVSVGGTQTYQGPVQPVAVSLGGTGVATTVSILITSAGKQYKSSLTIQPQDLSLIAEPLSSAPPLYPGKPLIPSAGNTRMVAVANFKDASGKTLDPTTLSYSWTVDGTQIAKSSGIGRNTIIVASPLKYRKRSVSVIVQSQAGSLASSASFSFEPNEPSVRIYENDPLLGIRFDHALAGTRTIQGTEASFYAAPFSFPILTTAPTLQWFLNGSAAQTGTLITLRPSGSGKGSASLSLTASIPDAVTYNPLTAIAKLALSFGTQSSTNFFDL